MSLSAFGVDHGYEISKGRIPAVPRKPMNPKAKKALQYGAAVGGGAALGLSGAKGKDKLEKRLPGNTAGGLKGLLAPYKGAVPKAATTGTNRPMENLMAPYKGAVPSGRTVSGPKHRALRGKIRNAEYNKKNPTGKPGEPMPIRKARDEGKGKKAVAGTALGAVGGAHVGGMIASGGPRKYVSDAKRAQQVAQDAAYNNPNLTNARLTRMSGEEGLGPALKETFKVGRENARHASSALNQVPELRRMRTGNKFGMAAGAAAGGAYVLGRDKKK